MHTYESPGAYANLCKEAQICNIRFLLDKTVVVGQIEEIKILARIDSDVFNLDSVLFSPYKDMLADRGIIAANSISYITEDGRIPIRIKNVKHRKITLFKNTKMNNVKPILETGNIKENIFRNYLNGNIDHIQCILKSIDNNTTSNHKKMKVKDIIVEFADVFSRNKNDIGPCKMLKHEIDLIDSKPIAQPVRRAPFCLENHVDEMINVLKNNGIVRESTSPWFSLIVICQKRFRFIKWLLQY